MTRHKQATNILHRVIKIDEMGEGRSFITKGDANDTPDIDPVIPQNVVGKAVFVVRKAGWLSIPVKKFFGG